MVRIITFALAALASVLGLDPELHDPTAWFASEAGLAVVVAGAVVFLRKSISVSGIAVVIMSVVVGGGLSLLGYFGEIFAAGTTIAQALMFGAGAGWAASGGWDLFNAGKSLPAPEA